MEKRFQFIQSLTRKHLPIITGGLYSILVFECFYFAFTTLPNFDEQLYLFKGYQLAIGATHFLEPFTYWWNKMVGSFAFWGWVQLIAGKGLFGPRAAVALLNIAAAYFLQDIAKRWFQPLHRTLLIGLMIASFPMLSNWSVANSQVLVNFLLCFALWLLSKRSGWFSIILLALVTALMVLTRENMAFFIPPVFGYLYLRDGWKRAIFWLGGVATIGGIWFAANYPNDILLLTRFIPSITLPDFDIYQRFTVEQNSVEKFELAKSLRAFSYALWMAPIYYWGAIAGTLAVIFQKWAKGSDPDQYFMFLAVLFWFLFLPHIWVTQSLGYCVHCLATYSGFFISIGALLFLYALECPTEIKAWHQLSVWLSFWAFAVVALIMPMIEGAEVLIGEGLGWNEGLIWLTNALSNKFALSAQELRQTWLLISSIAAGAIAVLVFGLFFITLRVTKSKFQPSLNGLLLILVFYLAFSKLVIEQKVTDCRSNVVAWTESAAKDAIASFPNQPIVYLNGEWAAIPLLYMDQPYELFEPQLNSNFSYSSTIDDPGILQFGLWNEPLAREWREKANVFLFDQPEYENFSNLVEMTDFNIYNYQYSPNSCSNQIDLYVLIRRE